MIAVAVARPLLVNINKRSLRSRGVIPEGRTHRQLDSITITASKQSREELPLESVLGERDPPEKRGQNSTRYKKKMPHHSTLLATMEDQGKGGR
jgi:hypothetical protein